MARKDFEIAISIKPKENGNRYSQPVLETGYLPVQQALDQANEVITKKFGSGEMLTLQRERRRKRE